MVDVSNNYICCHTLFSTIYDFLLCSPLILQRARHFLKTELGGLVWLGKQINKNINKKISNADFKNNKWWTVIIQWSLFRDFCTAGEVINLEVPVWLALSNDNLWDVLDTRSGRSLKGGVQFGLMSHSVKWTVNRHIRHIRN